MKTRLLGAVFALVLVLGLSRAESDGQEYIVTLRSGHSISVLNHSHGTRTVGHIPHTPIFLIKTDTGDSDNSILEDIKKDKGVESVEKNAQVKLRSNQQASPSSGLAEGMASLLDGHTLTTFYGTNVLKSYVDQPALTLSHVNDVRNISTGAGTRVAYIDTGVDPYHPALRPWLDPGVDLLNNRSTSELDGLSEGMASLLDEGMASLLDQRFLFVLDEGMASLLDGGNDGGIFPSALGHGTLVAGVIHAVAPNARIVPIKAFDVYGYTTMFRIIQGVYRAKDLNVDVLNMSFSTPIYSVTLGNAIADAWAAGIAITASVGNDGHYMRDIYPANYPEVIGVGATDFNDHVASFSNYGLPVAIDATGAFVISTVPGGRYAAAWGTSFSAPIVSGAIALRASMRGHGHSDSSLVINTADNIDILNPGFKGQLGKGRVNVQRALKEGNQGNE